MADEELTDDEAVMRQLSQLANTATIPEEKHNAHTFLNAVATTEDTTRVGFLKEEEIGIPKLSVRTLKELALYSRDIADEPEWGEYLDKRSEIITASSLSKDAKLIELAITQTRNIANVTKHRKVNKSWFKRGEPTPEV